MDITKRLKDISQEISEGYNLFKKPINDHVRSMVRLGKIKNNEELKRVCEFVNNNVYLALFNDPSVDKSNINFDKADYNSLKKEEGSMSDYKTVPSNYRDLENSIDLDVQKEASQGPTEHEKLAAETSFGNLMNNIKDVEYIFVKEAEEAYGLMESDAKVAMNDGDSLGDLAKLAARYAHGCGLDFRKVARAYDIISNDLSDSGHTFSTDLTKVSSLSIDVGSPLYNPIEKFATAVDALVSLREIRKGIIDELKK